MKEDSKTQAYEQGFDQFLEHPAYDKASESVFQLARAAYRQGFLAAVAILGGDAEKWTEPKHKKT